MAKVELKNLKNEKVKDLSISDSIWKIEVNDDCLKKMIRLQLAATRQGTAKTKTRSEVSGGGRKPWRQKGTGNARQGSIRAPHWVGGGVIFGPTSNRNYTKKMNKKERRLALKSALTYKATDKAIIVVDKFDAETSKTKDMMKVLEGLKVTGKTLIVTTELTENLILSTRNLSNIKVVLANELNTYDVLYVDKMIITEDAVKYIEEVLK